ncbi:MAG: hypothetical protein H6622_13305 [Halobacteriovoraceae bacterium]|nr:hypothetical protein [Halobacteriovoraceae bacterium]
MVAKTLTLLLLSFSLQNSAHADFFNNLKLKALQFAQDHNLMSKHIKNSGYTRNLNIGKCGAGHTPYNCEFNKRGKRQRGPIKTPVAKSNDMSELRDFLAEKGSPTVKFKYGAQILEDGKKRAVYIAVREDGTEIVLHKRLFETDELFTRDNFREFLRFLIKEGSLYDYVLDSKRPIEEIYFSLWDFMPNDEYLSPDSFMNLAVYVELFENAAYNGTKPPNKRCGEQQTPPEAVVLAEIKNPSIHKAKLFKKDRCIFTRRDYIQRKRRLEDALKLKKTSAFMLNLIFPQKAYSSESEPEIQIQPINAIKFQNEDKDLVIEKYNTSSNELNIAFYINALQSRRNSITGDEVAFDDMEDQVKCAEERLKQEANELKSNTQKTEEMILEEHKLKTYLDTAIKMLDVKKTCTLDSVSKCNDLARDAAHIKVTDEDMQDMNFKHSQLQAERAEFNPDEKTTMTMYTTDGEKTKIESTLKDVVKNGWDLPNGEKQDPSAFRDYSNIKDDDERLATVASDIRFAANSYGVKVSDEKALEMAKEISNSVSKKMNFQEMFSVRKKVAMPSKNSGYMKAATESFKSKIQKQRLQDSIIAKQKEINTSLGEHATKEERIAAYKNDPDIQRLEKELEKIENKKKELEKIVSHEQTKVEDEIVPKEPEEDYSPERDPQPKEIAIKPRVKTNGRGQTAISSPSNGGYTPRPRRSYNTGSGGGFSSGGSSGSGSVGYNPEYNGYAPTQKKKEDTESKEKPSKSPKREIASIDEKKEDSKSRLVGKPEQEKKTGNKDGKSASKGENESEEMEFRPGELEYYFKTYAYYDDITKKNNVTFNEKLLEKSDRIIKAVVKYGLDNVTEKYHFFLTDERLTPAEFMKNENKEGFYIESENAYSRIMKPKPEIKILLEFK